MYASLQFCGHIEEYFSSHTEKLVVFIVMPRLKNKFNLLRVYKEGQMIEERRVWSSENIFLYYVAWYVSYLRFLLHYFDRHEKVIVLLSHPISFLGMSFQKVLRPITFAYWVGDYFPPVNVSLTLFERLKKHFHDSVPYRFYLSDRINQLFNGTAMNTKNIRTVMWGVKPITVPIMRLKKTLTILFVGLIKDSQGLELVFRFLKDNVNYRLNIIGVCDDRLYQKYQSLVQEYQLKDRIFFPNKFYSDGALQKLASSCHVGIAMYELSARSASYYTDPGKVKAYLEMGLPVVMSKTSSIAQFVQKYHCGEVVDAQVPAIADAFDRIAKNYAWYTRGVKDFNNYFFYERYYRKSFAVFENI